MTVARAFDLISKVYDTRLIQRIGYRANHDAVIAELRRIGARRVVDVGSGTGILATRIAEELAPDLVFGCDPSHGMLEQARRRSGQVRWLRASAERLPIDDEAVDAVVSTEAFQFFDQAAALREFHRVIEPGGHLVVAVLTPVIDTSRLVPRAPARWPTREQMRQMAADAAFAVEAQRPVHEWLGPLSPGVATVARRP